MPSHEEEIAKHVADLRLARETGDAEEKELTDMIEKHQQGLTSIKTLADDVKKYIEEKNRFVDVFFFFFFFYTKGITYSFIRILWVRFFCDKRSFGRVGVSFSSCASFSGGLKPFAQVCN